MRSGAGGAVSSICGTELVLELLRFRFDFLEDDEATEDAECEEFGLVVKKRRKDRDADWAIGGGS